MDKLFSLHMDKISAIKMLPDEQIGKVLKHLIEYQETGCLKNIDSVIAFPFEILRQSLDVLNEKRAKTSEKQRNRAKNRWGASDDTTASHGMPENAVAYRGIPDDAGACQNMPDDANTETVTETEKKTVTDTNSSQEKFINQGGGSKQPPPQIKQIIQESEAQGFFIDTKVAKKFQTGVINSQWLIGPHSFLEFTAAAVRKKYPDKGNDELKPLYISAVTSWEDLRSAYPPWRKKQEEIIASITKAETYERAKANKPQRCQCGGRLEDWLVCKLCKGFYFFDDTALQYIYEPPGAKSIKDGLDQLIKNSSE